MSLARIAAIYDSVADRYDEWKWQHFWHRNELPLVEKILRAQPSARRTLDVGAGTGAAAGVLAAHSESVDAVDISAGMLRRRRTRFPEQPVVRGDASALPFRSEAFDRAAASRLLTHISDVAPLFAEVRRVLRPGALFVVAELHPTLRYETTTFGLGPAGCADPIAPIRHSIDDVATAARTAGFSVETLEVTTLGSLRWRPPAGEYATLEVAQDAPVFYLAQLRAS